MIYIYINDIYIYIYKAILEFVSLFIYKYVLSYIKYKTTDLLLSEIFKKQRKATKKGYKRYKYLSEDEKTVGNNVRLVE